MIDAIEIVFGFCAEFFLYGIVGGSLLVFLLSMFATACGLFT